jgi:hypothetical protein
MRSLVFTAGLTLLLAGCEEKLTIPGQCPDFCVGGRTEVTDTVIYANQGGDSTFVGYAGWGQLTSLLISDGLPAGEARGWYRFPVRSDSIPISGSNHAYTVDSLRFEIGLAARDTSVDSLVLYIHQIPITVDTVTTFDGLDSLLTPETLLDSVVVADSLRQGSMVASLTGDEVGRLVVRPEDGGRIAIGLRIRAAAPTGIRVGAIAGLFGPAGFTTYARVAGVDSAVAKQTLVLTAEANGFVRDNGAAPADPDRLYAGRMPASRFFLRFAIPVGLLDSATIIRATLELTPAEPVTGLRGDNGVLLLRSVVKDIGAKSSLSQLVTVSDTLPTASADVIRIDVIQLLGLWQAELGIPQTVVALLSPEGSSFHQPVFQSTRGAQGPRLRISYLRAAAVERP